MSQNGRSYTINIIERPHILPPLCVTNVSLSVFGRSKSGFEPAGPRTVWAGWRYFEGDSDLAGDPEWSLDVVAISLSRRRCKTEKKKEKEIFQGTSKKTKCDC